MAQKEANIWYFGANAGLDFNSGSPVALLDGALFTNEGCATISDSDGNLLFYTDGVTVYNRNHNIMLNGTGLAGSFTSTHSAIIVPKLGFANRYYIFTVDTPWNTDTPDHSTAEFSDAGSMTFSGSDSEGNVFAMASLVTFQGGTYITYDLDVSNTDNGKLIDGKSTISGVSLNITVGITTDYTGLTLNPGIVGHVGINNIYTASGERPSFISSPLSTISGNFIYDRSEGATGTASLTVPFNRFRYASASFTGGLKDITVNAHLSGEYVKLPWQVQYFSVNGFTNFIHHY